MPSGFIIFFLRHTEKKLYLLTRILNNFFNENFLKTIQISNKKICTFFVTINNKKKSIISKKKLMKNY